MKKDIFKKLTFVCVTSVFIACTNNCDDINNGVMMNDNKDKILINKKIQDENVENVKLKEQFKDVTDFDSCVKAGGIILKTLPPKCKNLYTGEVYTKK